MLRLDFHEPLTALEIREPTMDVCREVANEFGVYAVFQQSQQSAFDGYSGQRNRTRIGNGKHKLWSIDFQNEPRRASKPTVFGRIAIRAPFRPDEKLYSGFDYGKHGEVSPTYSFITVHTPSELGAYRPNNPSPDILDMTYEGLTEMFVSGYPRLFDVAELTN